MTEPRKSRRERKAQAERIARFHRAREMATRGSTRMPLVDDPVTRSGGMPGNGPTGASGTEALSSDPMPASQAPRGLAGRASGQEVTGPEMGVGRAGLSRRAAGGGGVKRSRWPGRAQIPPRERRQWRTLDSFVAVGFVAVIAVTMMVTIGRGAAVFDHGWRGWALASGLTVTGCVTYGFTRFLARRERPPMRLSVAVVTVAVVVVSAFTVGADNSVFLNGRIVPSTSKEAVVYRTARSMRADLIRISELDRLLLLDTAEARARFGEYEPAISELDAISAKWAARDPGSFGDADLAPVASDLTVGAHFAAVAMEKKRDLLTTDDSRLAADVATNRDGAVNAALDAGPKLAAVAAEYGFSVAVDKQAVVE